jgi:putative addiction module killer protein
MRLVVREYLEASGRSPFREWLDELDTPVRARVQARILRFELGNLGDCKSVGAGVWEARLSHGPGYRLYFARHGRDVILLLVGGDKGSQPADIRRAKRLWRDFQETDEHG